MMTYIIKSAIVLSALYLPYMLLLRKESFFRFNRAMLLCIMMLSLTLPLFDIHALSWESNPMSEHLPSYTQPVLVPSPHEPQADAVLATAETGSTNWWHIISLLYIIGMAIMLATKLTQLGILYRKIRQGVLWADKQEGVTIYCHIHPIAPFSWMRSIVISEDDYTNNASTILRHEMGHIQNHHSLDIVLLNACQIIQWANPLVWVMAHSLRDVHEYEADDAVLRSGVSIHQYHNLLIKKAVGSSSYAFANSFNHSLLKKRITMMLKKKSNPWMRSKALYILPVAVVALSAFATPELNNRANTGTEVMNSGKVTEKSATSQDLKNFSASTAPDEEDTIFMICEEMPEFEGGAAKMMEHLMRNLKYPKEAQEHGIQGRVIVSFVVEKDGSCTNFEVVSNSSEAKDIRATVVTVQNTGKETEETTNAEDERKVQAAKEALNQEAIRVCKLMKFKPGKQRGQAVRVRFTVPITFRLQ